MAICFVAGLWIAPEFRPAPLRLVESAVMIAPAVPRSPTIVSLPELEQQAEQAEDVERARIYFVAGRRYASELGDWHSAMRCYQQALDAAPKEAEQIDPKSDDWLLIALKIERQKERENAIRNE
jgi:hypothetical protein